MCTYTHTYLVYCNACSRPIFLPHLDVVHLFLWIHMHVPSTSSAPLCLCPLQTGWIWVMIYCPYNHKTHSSLFAGNVCCTTVGGWPRTIRSLTPVRTLVKQNKTNSRRKTQREFRITAKKHDRSTACTVHQKDTGTDAMHAHTHKDKSPSVVAVCLSLLSSCNEIRGGHQRNLLLGYKTVVAQGKNGNASDSGGRGLPGCNHSC